jgi:cytochrome c oxidase subunit 4
MEHIVSPRVYITIFAALMVLTATTVAVAFIDLGIFNNVIMLTIALTKTLLVVLYFMHMRHSGKLIPVFAVGALMWLAILITLTLSDYLTRGWLPAPVGIPQ